MKFKVLATYSSATASNHLSSPSGQYLKPDGTPYQVSDLSMLDDMYQDVLNGKMESFTDKKYVKKSMGNTGGPTAKGDKAPQHVDHFDHVVIQDIPATLDVALLASIVKQELNSDIFYRENQGGGKFKNTYVTGEREILDRIETSPSGNRHLHLFINRRGIVSKQQLQDDLVKWKNSSDVNKDIVIDGITNAIGKMNIAGVDKALAQGLSMNGTYPQQLMLERINNALQNAGISPIAQAGSYSATDNNNRKTTPEAKQAVNEIIDNDFSEESVKKVVEEITNEEYSSVDSVIIQKRLAENKTRAEQLATELQKVVSESKQLEQAQKAVNENSMLKGQLEKLSGVIERVNKTVEEKNEYIEILKNNHQDEIDEINRENKVKIIRKDEEIQEKTEKLKALEEEFDTTWKDKEAVEAQFKEYVEKTDKELEQIPQLQELLNTANVQNKQYQEMFALQQEQIKQNQELLKQTQEQFKESQEQLKLSNEENIKLTKQRIEIEEIKEKAFADLKKLSEEFAQKQEENKELAKANQELKNANSVLSNTLTQFAELSNKLKTNYTKFIGAMRDKLKTNPALKKEISNINRDFANFEKQNQTIEKEVKTVVESVKTDKALTDSQKSLLNMFGTQEQKKPDTQTTNRTNPTGRKPT